MAIYLVAISSFRSPETASLAIFRCSNPIRTLLANHRSLRSSAISVACLSGNSDVPGAVLEIGTRALKDTWDHIKLHNLQDPTNRKIILWDEKLK